MKSFFKNSLAGIVLCMALAMLLCAPVQAENEGKVRFFNNASTEFNSYIKAPSTLQKQWIQTNYVRMLVYSTHFDKHTSWYPGGLAYIDAYAIYTNDAIANSHPEWIMRDTRGNKLYIPWACNNGACSQYAGDFSNPAFRSHMIAKMAALVAKGYRGVWLDDVNLTWRVSDGWGKFTAPLDKNTGKPMTLANWQLYFTRYLEQVRAALPKAEISHNVIWYAGNTENRNPYINREIDATNYVMLERGGNDSGLVGGNGQWGFESLLNFIDYVHWRGSDVIIMDNSLHDTTNPVKLEYGLATWLLISNGNDMLGNLATNRMRYSAPDMWWPGYSTSLGNAKTGRYKWRGLIRRDFERGIVLLNQPNAITVDTALGGCFRSINGKIVTSTRLAAKQAAVLRGCNL